MMKFNTCILLNTILVQSTKKILSLKFQVKIHLAMHHAGKVETLHNLLSAHAVLVVVLVSTVLQVSSSEELGMNEIFFVRDNSENLHIYQPNPKTSDRLLLLFFHHQNSCFDR